MADPKQIAMKVEDWMGVNRQETQEQIQDNYFWTLQNLYERKLGELQRRGGSQFKTNTTKPSNISSIDSNYILYDKVLGKTQILKVGCTPLASTITDTQVTASFVTSPAGNWGQGTVGITNAFCGASALGVILVGVGFGIQAQINSAITASLPVSGNTKTFQVVIAAGGVTNTNLRAIEVYAYVGYAYHSTAIQQRLMWVGTIDLIANPSGTFNFPYAPVTLGADPGAPASIGFTDATIGVTTALNAGGSFIPGKTYYVAALSQLINYDSNSVETNLQCYYVAQSIQTVTIPVGSNSLNIAKLSGGSAGTIIAVGLHPNQLRPIMLAPPSATWSVTVLSMATSCSPGVINFIPNSSIINTGFWVFEATDINVDDMFAYIDANNNWIPIYINNFFGNNNILTGISVHPAFDPNFASGYTPTGYGVSAGANFSGYQYVSQTQELMFLCPKNNYQQGVVLPLDTSIIGFTGNFTSGSGSVPAITYPAGFVPGASTYIVVGPNIPLGTTATFSGTTMTMSQNANANGNAEPFIVLAVANGNRWPQPAHNIIEFDGQCATMATMDFNCQAPPYFSFLGVYQEHLLGAGGNGQSRNKMYFANPFDPFNWTVPGDPVVVQYVQCESEGEDINGLGTYVNTMNLTGPIEQILLCKRSSLWVLTTLPTYTSSSSNNALMTSLSRKAGCANNRCIVNTEVGTIVAGVDNVWLVRGTGEPTPIGEEIKWFLRSEDPTQTIDPTNWSVVYHDNHFKLAFSSPGSSIPNQELWLNISKMKKMKGQPCWYGPMVGRNCYAQTVEVQFNDTILPRRWSVDQQNLYWYWADREDFSQDFSTDLSFLVLTKNYGMKDDDVNKLFKGSMWKMKVDQNLTFTETMTSLSNSGQNTDTNSRVADIVTGYTASNYANFVANCRAKLYRFFAANRGLRGENIDVQWSYTGPIYFTIAGLTMFYKPEARLPGLPGSG